MPRFKVSEFMKGRKKLREEVFMKKRRIEEVSEELKQTETELKEKEKIVKAKADRLRYLDSKVKTMVDEIEDMEDIRGSLGREREQDASLGRERRKDAHILSDKSVIERRKNPTSFSNGTLNQNRTVRGRRRSEMFQASKQINGASEESSVPAQVGLIDTAIAKCNKVVLTDAIGNSKKIMNQVLPKVFNSKISLYESSDENMVRSVGVYYSGGVMGKKKYRKIYRDTAFKRNHKTKKTMRTTVAHIPFARLVPYNKLISFVKLIPIGTLYDVSDTLCTGLNDEHKVRGCYRDIRDTLIMLANFYLAHSEYELNWFNEPYTFVVTLGGDAAPFGKYDTASAWLVGFLNIGRGILSSNENFLLFGANCGETCLAVQRYVSMLLKQLNEIEKQSFPLTHNGVSVNVKFRIGELPNDMKMMAFLAGELSNSSKFFSSFGNVSSDNGDDIHGTFGTENNNKWKPWKYSTREKVAKQVAIFKKKVENEKTAATTKRSKVTKYIANQNSRQEFVPPLGKLIDRAHIEPLHLKNNACGYYHRILLQEAVTLSNLTTSITNFSQLKPTSPLCKFVNALRTDCHLSRLSKNIVKWFNENRGEGKQFDVRFTGKESKGFLHGFMYLIAVLMPFAKEGSQNECDLHALSYICLSLRDCVSLFNRLDISDLQVRDLEQQCRIIFRLNNFFFSFHPTIWHIGHIIPAHTRDMKNKYGMGLALNSMEGRESKHASIARYSSNTVYHLRWQQIFLHEYVSLVWLRERGYNISMPSSARNLSYIPKRALNDSNFCYCGHPKEASELKCVFCLHPLRRKMLESVVKGKNLVTGK